MTAEETSTLSAALLDAGMPLEILFAGIATGEVGVLPAFGLFALAAAHFMTTRQGIAEFIEYDATRRRESGLPPSQKAGTFFIDHRGRLICEGFATRARFAGCYSWIAKREPLDDIENPVYSAETHQ